MHKKTETYIAQALDDIGHSLRMIAEAVERCAEQARENEDYDLVGELDDIAISLAQEARVVRHRHPPSEGVRNQWLELEREHTADGRRFRVWRLLRDIPTQMAVPFLKVGGRGHPQAGDLLWENVDAHNDTKQWFRRSGVRVASPKHRHIQYLLEGLEEYREARRRRPGPVSEPIQANSDLAALFELIQSTGAAFGEEEE